MSQLENPLTGVITESPVQQGPPELNPVRLPHTGSTPLRLIILAAVFVLPSLYLLGPVKDADIWWHLRTGQWVVEQGTVPSTDPFSAHVPARPWVAYSWLFEVLVYSCYRALGLTGVLLLNLALAYLVSVVLYRYIARRIPAFLPSAALTALALAALMPLFSPRPWLFSMLFSLLTLEAIGHLQSGRRCWYVWLLPVGYVIWANVHIQFIYGLLLLALAWTAPLLDALFGRQPTGSSPRPLSPAWSRLLALFGLCALATLVNPYQVRVYGVVWEYATQPLPYMILNELHAPTFRYLGEWVMLLLFGLAAFSLGRQRGWGGFEALLLAASAVLAFRSRRDEWVLVFASTAILCRDPALAGGGALVDRFRWTWGRFAVVGGAVVGLVLFLGYSEQLTEENLHALVEDQYPAGAVRWVAEKGVPGPLYNDFNWGGYLIWELHRKGVEMPVAIDGRTNLHGDEHLERYFSTWGGKPGWEQDPDLSAAGVIILPESSPLAGLLQRDPRFEFIPLDFSPARLFIARRNLPAR